MENWKQWLEERKKATQIKLEERSIENIEPWRYKDGRVDRDDGLFFSVLGFFARLYKSGKLAFEWGQVLLKPEEPIHGWVVLAVARENDGDYLLLSVKPEPGWPDPHLAPSFQASKSKLMTQLDYPRRELADEGTQQLIWQDGGVHFNKRNHVGICLFSSRDEFADRLGELGPDERWFSLTEYKEAFAFGEVSDHLLQTVACLYTHNI